MSTLQNLVRYRNKLREEKKDIEERLAEFDSQIMEALEAVEDNRTTVEYDDQEYSVVRVQGTRVSYDQKKLRKAVGAIQYKALCREVFDAKLLEQAIRDDKIKTSTVSKCATIENNKPYLRVTPVEHKNDDQGE